MEAEDRFQHARERMVDQQIARRGIRDERLLDVLRAVPRHKFVPPESQNMAYEDFPVRIGQGQTVSQPYIVALMTSLLALEGGETLLEVGTGSGYQAAVLARLAQMVHTIERHADLAAQAQAVLDSLGVDNVRIHVGDGSLGWPESAPYDGILVTAAAPRPPQPLLEQLADGGRLVAPVGDRFMQELQVWQRKGPSYERHHSIGVAFVPLRGEHGWNEDW